MKPAIHQVTVGTFHKLVDAVAFRQFLATEGIAAKINDERLIQRIFLLSSPKAGLHVKVDPPQVEAAEAALARWETPARKALHCPHCKSSRIEYPQLPRNFILTSIMQHLAILLRIERRSYHCKHCDHMWRRDLPSLQPKHA